LDEIGNTGEAFDACEISKLLEPDKIKYCKDLSRLSKSLQKSTLVQRYIKQRVLLCISDAKLVYKHAYHKVALDLLEKACHMNPEQALQAFDEALRVRPSDILALLGRATALRSLKNYDQAIETYNRVLQIDSHLIEASVGKGHSCFVYGKSIEALNAYQDAIN